MPDTLLRGRAPFDALPPELGAEEQALAQRQQLAQMLLQRGMQPLPVNRSAGRFNIPISPFEGLTQLAQAGGGVALQGGVDRGRQSIADRYNLGLQGALQNYQQQKAGSPAEPPEPGQDIHAQPTPAVPGDPRAAAEGALVSHYQPLQRLAEFDLRQMHEASQRKERQEHQRQLLEESQAARAAEAEAARRAALQRTREHDATLKAIAATRAGAGAAALPKPKAGYMWKKPADQNSAPEQVMIKGGPAWQKAKEAADKDTKNVKLLESTLNAEIQNINKLIGSPDGRIKEHKGLPAMVGSIDPFIPTVRSNTADAVALLRSLQSKASISSLMTIRGTAGAIGTLTEREWPRLEQMKAALTEKQSEKQFRESLKDYRDELIRVLRVSNEALANEHSELRNAEEPKVLDFNNMSR